MSGDPCHHVHRAVEGLDWVCQDCRLVGGKAGMSQIVEPHATIICVRRSRPTCIACGAPGVKLCDYPVAKAVFGQPAAKQTCDAPICSQHASREGPNLDYCPDHRTIGDPPNLLALTGRR